MSLFGFGSTLAEEELEEYNHQSVYHKMIDLNKWKFILISTKKIFF